MNKSTTNLPYVLPKKLNNQLEKRTFKTWESIRPQGVQPEFFYLIGQGLVGEFRYLNNSKKILVSKHTNGDIPGSEELKTSQESSSSLVSLSPTVLYRGTRDDLETYENNQDGPPYLNDRGSLSRQQYHEKLDQVLTLKLEQRLAIELLELALHAGEQTDESIRIVIPLSRTNLSNILGCAAETISRIVSDWTKNKIIETNQKIINILRPELLMIKTPDRYQPVSEFSPAA